MKKITLLSLAASCVLLGLPLAARAAEAKDNWAKNCGSCHGKDGKAQTKAARLCGAKDLTDPKYQKTFTDEAAFKDTKEGLVTEGKTRMKPFKDKLTDDEIKGLIAYVRGLAK